MSRVFIHNILVVCLWHIECRKILLASKVIENVLHSRIDMRSGWIFLFNFLLIYTKSHTFVFFPYTNHGTSIRWIRALNPKTAGGGQFDPPPPPSPSHCGFSKNVSSIERVKPWVFVTFHIIISHMYPEHFIEITQVVQKLWRMSLSILAIFIDFYRFSGFSDISLLQKTNCVSL